MAPPPNQVAQRLARRRIVTLLNVIMTYLSMAWTLLAQEIDGAPEPYHTSALTGHAWVLELIAGHPDRIRCELGVSLEVFLALLEELQSFGHTRSKYVTLEEQLAIFLHMSVTGATVRHAGERFQRSNETISRYVVYLSIYLC